MKKIILLLLLILFVSCLNKDYSEFQIIDGKGIGKLRLGKKLNAKNINKYIGYQINSDSIITELYTSSKKYYTLKGIRVGDKVQVVKHKYGKPFKQEFELKKGGVIIGKIDEFLIYKHLVFYHKNDTIISIGVLKQSLFGQIKLPELKKVSNTEKKPD